MEFEPGSFRDRTGRIFYAEGRVYRALTANALAEWEALASTAFFARATAEGRIVATERLPPGAGPEPPSGNGTWAAVLRHRTIPFVSYPYEWCFGMLRDAALLTLELLEGALAEGLTLKDATPYNVQWHEGRPVFIDALSFTRRQPGEPWVGYRQFCELFLYPLLLEAYKGVGFQPWLRGRIDGIPPREMRRLLSARDLLRPGVLAHVVLHAASEERFDARPGNVKRQLADAGFGRELILANVRRLRRLVGKLAPPESESAWSGYATDNSYDQADRDAKERFVRAALGTRRWRLVWDLGANTGAFSSLAAAHADEVVALEADRVAVERLYQAVRRQGQGNVLPLVANLADPSPALGWRGSERRDLPGRGRPDLVLCLALIHHLTLGANLGVADLLSWLAGLGGSLVIEFVRREDPMVERLLRHKDETYDDYDLAPFEAALGARFEVLRRSELPSGRRVLYFAHPRRAA